MKHFYENFICFIAYLNDYFFFKVYFQCLYMNFQFETSPSVYPYIQQRIHTIFENYIKTEMGIISSFYVCSRLS